MAESQFATCRILYANDPPDPSDAFETDDWIEIEQVGDVGGKSDWMTKWLSENPVTSGSTTTLDAVIGRINSMHNYWSDSCGDDDCIEVELEVHKSRDDLDYDLVASYGELSAKSKSPKQKIERIEIDGEESYTLKTEAQGQISAEWDAGAVGEISEGVTQALASPPVPVQDGQTLSFGRRMWGTLMLKYTASPDTFFLTLVPREEGEFDPEEPKSAYASTVRAVWAGEPVKKEIDVPDIDTSCPGARVVINPDDPNQKRCWKWKIRKQRCRPDAEPEDLGVVQIPCKKDTDDTEAST